MSGVQREVGSGIECTFGQGHVGGQWAGQVPARGQWVVYHLWDGSMPVYVGSTGDLMRRLSEHLNSGKQFTRWEAEGYDTRDEARAAEDDFLSDVAALTGILPRYNKQAFYLQRAGSGPYPFDMRRDAE